MGNGNYRSLFILFFIIFPIELFSQSAKESIQICFSGKVVDIETSEPVPGVIVMLRDSVSHKIYKYTQCGANGEYSIIGTRNESLHGYLHFTMMGYAGALVKLEKGGQHYDVALRQKATKIKEVVVKAAKIEQEGDTISYNVASFAAIQDKNIGDVIRKMPGLDVTSTGEIKFNGKPINKFYIEGLDLLEGKYGLATNNIPQKDVKSVEVMDHHQPIKALKDITYSQSAAINIRLKEDAKAKWIATIKGGTGFTPFLWNAELFAMRISAKMQSINTLKTNNIAKNITKELSNFTIDNIVNGDNKYDLPNYLSVNTSTVPLLKEERWRFNESYVFSTNNLWKLKSNYELKLQMSYLHNKLDSKSLSKTTYFFEDGITVADEGESFAAKLHGVTANMVLFANHEKYYLKNSLSTDVSWNTTNILTSGDYANVQKASMPSYKLSNDLAIVKSFGNKAVSFKSFNMIALKPQNLSITREKSAQYESIRSSAVYSNTSASFSSVIGKFILSFNGGAALAIKGLKSNVSSTGTGKGEITDSLGNKLINNSLLGYVKGYASVKGEYKIGPATAALNVPINYYYYWFRDFYNGNRNPNHDLLLNPSFSLRLDISPMLQLSASGSVGSTGINYNNFYSGMILTNYRDINIGNTNYINNKNKTAGVALSYKNPLKAIFINVSANRSWLTSGQTSNTLFLDNYIVRSYYNEKSRMAMWLFSGTISKGIDGIHGLVSLNASYSKADATSIQNKIPTPYTTHSITITPAFDARFAKWCRFDYKFNYSYNDLKINNVSSTNQFNHSLLFVFSPNKKININIQGEHYYTQLETKQSKNVFLADFAVSYSFTDNFEISCSASNLLNHKVYSYTLFNGLSSYYCEYAIRPRNIMFNVYLKL